MSELSDLMREVLSGCRVAGYAPGNEASINLPQGGGPYLKDRSLEGAAPRKCARCRESFQPTVKRRMFCARCFTRISRAGASFELG